MGANTYYSENGHDMEEIPMMDKPESKSQRRFPWGKHSFCGVAAVGITLGVVLCVVVAALGSLVLNKPLTTTAPATTSSPAPALSPSHPDQNTTAAALAQIKDCGENAAEARAKGCVFDVMMQLWMSPECYDGNLSERHLKNGNWTWYADEYATKALSLDQMRQGEHDVIYVAQSYHRDHCIFAWEKLVRAMRNDAPLIQELISFDHVMHCRHKTLTPAENDGVRGVRAPTGFTRCAKYSVWLNALPKEKMSSVDK